MSTRTHSRRRQHRRCIRPAWATLLGVALVLGHAASVPAGHDGPRRFQVSATVESDGVRGEVVRSVELATLSDGITVLRCLDASHRGAFRYASRIEGNEDGTRSVLISEVEIKGSLSSLPPVAVLRHVVLSFAWSEASLGASGLTLGMPSTAGVEPPRGRWPGPGERVELSEDPLWFHLASVPDFVLLLPGVKEPSWPPAAGSWSSEAGSGLRLDASWTVVESTPERARMSIDAVLHGVIFPPRPGPALERTVRGEAVLDRGGLVEGRWRADSSVRSTNGASSLRARHEVRVVMLDSATPEGLVRAEIVRSRSDPATWWREVILGHVPEAEALVLQARPRASVRDVQFEPWLASTAFPPEDPAEAAWNERVGALLGELGILTRDQAASVIQGYQGGRHGPEWAAAVAILGDDRVLVRPESATHVPMLAHELAHVADSRAGRGGTTDWMLTRDGVADPAWGNLDAAIASGALLEAGAELTEILGELAMNRPKVVDRAWSRIAAAKPTDEPADLLDALLDWLYAASRALVGARHVRGESLDDTLDRTWMGFSFTTRELLDPHGTNPPSALWALARERDRELREAGALEGTRIGSLALRQIVLVRGIAREKPATRLALALVDDLVVRDEGGVTWLLRFSDDRAAADATPLLRALLLDAALRHDGSHAVVTVGRPSEAVLRLLTDSIGPATR